MLEVLVNSFVGAFHEDLTKAITSTLRSNAVLKALPKDKLIDFLTVELVKMGIKETGKEIINAFLGALDKSVQLPQQVAAEKKTVMLPVAKQTPPQQINFSVQTGLQEFQKLAKPFQPIAEPLIQVVKPPSDKDQLTGLNQKGGQQQLTPVKDMPFTQTYSGGYEKPSESPYKIAIYRNTDPCSGTRTGVYPGSFTANYSITATSTENNTFSAYSSGTFTATMTGKVSGFQEGTLKGTGNMNMTAGTTGGTNFNFSGPVTIEPSGKLTFGTSGTFTLGNHSGTTTGTWTQTPK
jgi:hypothetical protein